VAYGFPRAAFEKASLAFAVRSSLPFPGSIYPAPFWLMFPLDPC